MLRIAGKTDVGKKRAANEDGFFVAKLSSDAAYAVVCDGMGGENGGHVRQLLRRGADPKDGRGRLPGGF